MHVSATRLAAALAAGLLGLAAQAETQTWNYKSYLKDKLSGQYSKDHFRTSTIRLEEQDGKATFRMMAAGRGDPCISERDFPAEVERSAETTIIVVKPPLAGCEPFRYVIRNDGSGGVRYNFRDDRWKPDGMDHDLTPAK